MFVPLFYSFFIFLFLWMPVAKLTITPREHFDSNVESNYAFVLVLLSVNVYQSSRHFLNQSQTKNLCVARIHKFSRA